MATTSINIYASGLGLVGEGVDNVHVTLNGIDIDNIVAEFPVSEVLDALDLIDIQAYLEERLADNE